MDTRWLRCAVLLLGYLCSCQCQDFTTVSSLQTADTATPQGTEISTLPGHTTTPVPLETSSANNLNENLTTTAASQHDVTTDSPASDVTTSFPDAVTTALGADPTTKGVTTTVASEDATSPTAASPASDAIITTVSNEVSTVTSTVQEQSTTGVPNGSIAPSDESSTSSTTELSSSEQTPTTLSSNSSQQETTTVEAASPPHVATTETPSTEGADPTITVPAGITSTEQANQDDVGPTTTVAGETSKTLQDTLSVTTTEAPSSPDGITVSNTAEEIKTTTAITEEPSTTEYQPQRNNDPTPTVPTSPPEATEPSTLKDEVLPTTELALVENETTQLTTESNDETTTTRASDDTSEGRSDVTAIAVSDKEVSTPSHHTAESNEETTEAPTTDFPSTSTLSMTTDGQQTTIVANITVATAQDKDDDQHTTLSQTDSEPSTEVPATTVLNSGGTTSAPGGAVEMTTDATTPEPFTSTIASEAVEPTSTDPPPTTQQEKTQTERENNATTTTLPLVPADVSVTDVSTTEDNSVITTTGATPLVQSEPAQTTTHVPVDSAPSDPEVTTGGSFTSTVPDMSTPIVILDTEPAAVTTTSTEGLDPTTTSAAVEGGASTPASETTTSGATISTGATHAMGGLPDDATTVNSITEHGSDSATVYAGPEKTTLVPTDLDGQTTTEGATSPVIIQTTTMPQEEVVPPIVITEAIADENDTSINLIPGSRNPKQFSGGETTTPPSPSPSEAVELTTVVNLLSTPEAAPEVTETTELHTATRFRSWFLNYTAGTAGEETTVSTPEETVPEEGSEEPDLLSTLFPELYGISSAAATILAAHDEEEATTKAEPSSTELASTTTGSATECDYQEDLSVDCLLATELNNTVTVEFSMWNDTQAEAFRTVLTKHLSDYCERIGSPLVKPRVVFIKSEHGMDMISFFVVNETRGSVVPSRILLPFLNETRPTLEDAVKLSISNAFFGFPSLKKHEDAFATAGTALNLIYIIVAACCAALIILIICILTLVKCRSTSHKYSPDSEKLSKDMALKAEIGDLRPGSEILKEEAQMKDTAAVINGNGTHLTKENDGWVVPYAQVPVEVKNAPDNQDTKL